MTGGKWLLSAEDIECMELGASLLGCGGGGDPNMGHLVALQQLAQGKSITIVNPFRSFTQYYVNIILVILSYVASK